jgi:glycosyltransferase involved in cell wall biosynthesis
VIANVGRLLLVAPFPYGRAAGHGGATAGAAMLRLLANRLDLEVLSFTRDTPADLESIAEMRAVAKRVEAVPLRVDRWSVLTAKMRSLSARCPEHASLFSSDAFEARLRDSVSRFRPHAVVFQFPVMAQYLSISASYRQIVDVQDAYSVSWYRRAAGKKGVARQMAVREWLNWVDYERRYYARADQLWTLSDQDRYGLQAFSPDLPAVNIGLPFGPTVSSSPCGPVESTAVVGFLGSFGHAPNIEALELIVDVLAPELLRGDQGVRILVAGRDPPSTLVDRAPRNVTFLGYVESLADFYGQCSVVVAPLVSGGGVKIKVVEAMRFGKAVVTTAIGAEGIDARSGEHFICVPKPDAIGRAVLSLLDDPARRRAMGAAAADFAADRFSDESWMARVTAALESLARS